MSTEPWKVLDGCRREDHVTKWQWENVEWVSWALLWVFFKFLPVFELVKVSRKPMKVRLKMTSRESVYEFSVISGFYSNERFNFKVRENGQCSILTRREVLRESKSWKAFRGLGLELLFKVWGVAVLTFQPVVWVYDVQNSMRVVSKSPWGLYGEGALGFGRGSLR